MIHDSLINAKWLKEFSVLPLNYNTKEIENFISIAEKIWVIPVIGYTFYEELLEQVRENKLTDVNSTALVEAIYPYLAMAVCYEALPSLWIHCSEVGLTLGSSDNSSSATLKDMTYYEQWIRRQLEARKDYCKKWLCQRFEYFPDLDVCGCGCDCCNNGAKLNTPNPNYQVYKPLNKNTNLR
jgi:hypothetical protein